MDPKSIVKSHVGEDEANHGEELRVTFYPELYLQRRVWILNFLRKENVTRVLDVGCGEGELLGVLCQPAPWLTPPPHTILPPVPIDPRDELVPPSPAYNNNEDEIPNLHITEAHGLDIFAPDLEFAMQAAAPPKDLNVIEENSSSPGFRSYTASVQRWEGLTSKVWKGGLEVINEEFVDMECIVGMEVIEHLPSDILPAFAPMLLGVYHPKYFLVTTPSYTFNARFTEPDAPASVRRGHPDPTGRTDRIFRHSDHKFEWTREEFTAWCHETAKEWGYEVNETSIGRPQEKDPWSRDAALQGATQVAAFWRLQEMTNKEREGKGKARLKELGVGGPSHEVLAAYQHPANPASIKPKTLEEIGKRVVEKMEDYRESFMRLEELWFEPEISTICGGWIEFLVRAVEDSPQLNLKRDVDGVRKGQSMWNIELIGGVANPVQYWSQEGETSVDYIPADWIPDESQYYNWESDMSGSTGAEEGDISAETSGDEGDDESDNGWGKETGWLRSAEKIAEVKSDSAWGEGVGWEGSRWSGGWADIPDSAKSSTAGWDGDESDDTTS